MAYLLEKCIAIGPWYTKAVETDIQSVLIDRHAIARRLDELAAEIIADLQDSCPGGDGEITLVPILTGSIIFLADLMRRLPMRMQIHLISISSYAGPTTSSRGAAVEATLTQLPTSLHDRHVLILDDILDSGKTLVLARDLLASRNPASLRTCVLLRKQRPEALAGGADYVGFDIPDDFVVGYGLDYDDYYRNLPDIVTLRPEIFRASR